MVNRDEYLIPLRPHLKNLVLENTGSIEVFQNEVLRPILKFQNDLILEIFKNDLLFLNGFNQTPLENRLNYCQEYIRKNNALKMLLVGIVIALLTVKELEFYLANQKDLNKRISNMAAQRYYDNTK